MTYLVIEIDEALSYNKQTENLSKKKKENSVEQIVFYLNQYTMLFSKLWYLHVMHCFTHILVMVYLLSVSLQKKN